ncbi:universal stress protein [Desulfococcaceae bacterium HSG9]|nr:universal stress protein [Desulfococcaceae bacterium HSG9]
MTDTILVGIDGSQDSRRAVEYGIAQAKLNNAQLVLAYVIEWSPYSFNTPEENEQRHKRREEEIQTAHKRVLNPLLESCASEELKITGTVRHGQVADALIQIGREHGAGLIVVGRIGQKGVTSLIFGSVVSKLIQLTHIPVTVVP